LKAPVAVTDPSFQKKEPPSASFDVAIAAAAEEEVQGIVQQDNIRKLKCGDGMIIPPLAVKDVQQDKELAYDYFLKSAEQGNIYAAYFLEHWNDMPHPDLFLMATRLMRHLEHIIEENVAGRKSGGRRQGIDRKLARKIRQKKIAQGHAVDDHENMVQTQ
jgi:NDP-sugar pyrophosphorylase family protein